MTRQDGQLTSMSPAKGFTSIPSGCFTASIQAETANIRYTEDGTTPSSSNGKLLIAGAAPTEIGGNLANFKFLDAGGTAKLNYTFFVDKTML